VKVSALKNASREGISAKPFKNTHPSSALFGNQQRIVNRVLVAVITLNSTPIPGQLLWSRRNRLSVPGSMLDAESQLFRRWRVNKSIYEFIPSVSTEFNGQIVLAQDPDPLSDYSTTSTAIQRLMTLPGSSIQQVFKGLKSRLPPNRDHTDLWVKDLDINEDDYSDRLSAAGTAYLACVAPGDMATGITIGSVFWEFDLTLYDPYLSPITLSTPTVVSFAHADMATFFANIWKSTSDDGSTFTGTTKIGLLDWMINMFENVSTSLKNLSRSWEVIESLYDYVSPFLTEDLRRSIRDPRTAFNAGQIGLPNGNYDCHLEINSTLNIPSGANPTAFIGATMFEIYNFAGTSIAFGNGGPLLYYKTSGGAGYATAAGLTSGTSYAGAVGLPVYVNRISKFNSIPYTQGMTLDFAYQVASGKFFYDTQVVASDWRGNHDLDDITSLSDSTMFLSFSNKSGTPAYIAASSESYVIPPLELDAKNLPSCRKDRQLPTDPYKRQMVNYRDLINMEVDVNNARRASSIILTGNPKKKITFEIENKQRESDIENKKEQARYSDTTNWGHLHDSLNFGTAIPRPTTIATITPSKKDVDNTAQYAFSYDAKLARENFDNEISQRRTYQKSLGIDSDSISSTHSVLKELSVSSIEEIPTKLLPVLITKDGRRVSCDELNPMLNKCLRLAFCRSFKNNATFLDNFQMFVMNYRNDHRYKHIANESTIFVCSLKEYLYPSASSSSSKLDELTRRENLRAIARAQEEQILELQRADDQRARDQELAEELKSLSNTPTPSNEESEVSEVDTDDESSDDDLIKVPTGDPHEKRVRIRKNKNLLLHIKEMQRKFAKYPNAVLKKSGKKLSDMMKQWQQKHAAEDIAIKSL